MARASTHNCTNCAAPLRIPEEHERFFRCEYCGTVLEDRSSGSTDAPDIGTAHTTVEVEVSYPVARERRAGPALTGLLVIGGIGLAAYLAVGTGSELAEQVGDLVDGRGPGFTSLAAATLVASDDDTSPDVVALGSTAGGQVLAYLDEEAPDGVRWTAPAPDDDSAQATALIAGTRLYVPTSERLSAYNREEGVELWSVPLKDTTYVHTCACVRLIGDALVVLASDGSVTSYDPAEGAERWSVLLPSTTNQIVDVGGLVGMIDQVDERWVLRTRDPVTGDTVHDVPLSCTVPGTDEQARLYAGASLTEIGGGALLFFGWTSDGTCVSRWDPGQAEATWHAAVPLDFFSKSGLDRGEGLQVGDTLYIGQEESVSAMSLQDGTVDVLVNSAEETFWPVTLDGDVLVVAAESTRGSTSWELRGVDTQTTNLRWVVELDGDEAIQYGRSTLTAGDTWFAVAATDGIAVVQVADDLSATVQLVPPGTGTTGPARPLDVPDVVAGFVKLPGAHGNDVWLALDGRILRFDVTDGSTTHLP